MPLTEVRHVKVLDGTEVVEDKTSERKLYTLAELKALDERPRPEQDDEIDSRAYQNAMEKLSEWNTEYDWWEADLESIAEVFAACGFEYKSADVEFDLDRGSKFVLPRNTSVYTKKFLKAFQIYLGGVDVRIPLLGYGDTEGNSKLAIKAIGTSIRKFDLRSKDARILREQGLVVYHVDRNSRSDEFDLDYNYDGMSDQTKADANEFLSDLCHHALTSLRMEMEYLQSEEALLEMADANDYRFDRNGKIA